ncbi:MAG: ATP-binding cassette domain-containing protein, partial [Clostridiaceae bacterium]|nr:ATP-binding cassette domain-containing protein [Clostridiaceae bacterium]
MSKNLSVISDVILHIENVNYTYYDDSGSHVEVLRDINLSVRRGEFLSIIGSSGCGKTTLLRLIAGLEKPETGTLILNGEQIFGPDPQRGYVFQNGGLFQWLTVEKNIATGLKARH